MPHPYTEDQLVEQPAIGWFAELGWATVSALKEVFGRSQGDETHPSSAECPSLLTSSPTVCLGREMKGEVVLASWVRAALERLNPALPPEAITAAVDEVILSGQVALASVSANGASSNQPGAPPQVSNQKYQKG